jgi:hypothetical protein
LKNRGSFVVAPRQPRGWLLHLYSVNPVPMFKSKLLGLLFFLLLSATSGWAQTRRAATPPPEDEDYKEVTVVVTVPKAVSAIRDYGKILLSRSDDKSRIERLSDRFRRKTEQDVVDVKVEVPKNWVTKKLGIAE